jgi:hypothetical protein
MHHYSTFDRLFIGGELTVLAAIVVIVGDALLKAHRRGLARLRRYNRGGNR